MVRFCYRFSFDIRINWTLSTTFVFVCVYFKFSTKFSPIFYNFCFIACTTLTHELRLKFLSCQIGDDRLNTDFHGVSLYVWYNFCIHIHVNCILIWLYDGMIWKSVDSFWSVVVFSHLFFPDFPTFSNVYVYVRYINVTKT